MPQSRKRKGARGSGPFVPRSMREHGTLDEMHTRRVSRPIKEDAPINQAARRHGLPVSTEPVVSRTIPTPARRPSHLGRNVAVGAGVLGAAAGAGYLVHRHNQRKRTMSKNLVNPFEEVVVFGKAYPVALPVPRAQRVRALVPTGRHVGHANDLKVVRRSGHSGGRATQLEIYRHSPRGLRPGPFGKAAGFMDAGKYKRSEKLLTSAIFGRNSDKVVTASGSAARKNRAQVQNGLSLINNPKVGNVSRVAPQRFSAPTPRINSNIPDGARRGGKLS